MVQFMVRPAAGNRVTGNPSGRSFSCGLRCAQQRGPAGEDPPVAPGAAGRARQDLPRRARRPPARGDAARRVRDRGGGGGRGGGLHRGPADQALERQDGPVLRTALAARAARARLPHVVPRPHLARRRQVPEACPGAPWRRRRSHAPAPPPPQAFHSSIESVWADHGCFIAQRPPAAVQGSQCCIAQHLRRATSFSGAAAAHNHILAAPATAAPVSANPAAARLRTKETHNKHRCRGTPQFRRLSPLRSGAARSGGAARRGRVAVGAACPDC